MAEAVIVTIAGEIIASTVSQALEKIGKLWGVKRELELLRHIVSTLRVVLEYAEKQYYQNEQIQDWLDRMKDALYDAQDVLEEFNIEAMQQELRGHNGLKKEVRTFFSSSNQLAFNLKMSSKVRAVRERIEALKTGIGFHLDMHSVESQVERERSKREETHSFICGGDVIGRDDDKERVKEFLLNPDMKEDVSILPIVGIGGLGKTALAQFVYNDEMVNKHFHLKMWVCVNDFDMTKIVMNIIACAGKMAPSGVAMEQLQSELRAAIDGKKYLLVLDDLWNDKQETWLGLKKLLGGGARGSKILITTRLNSVAALTHTAPPYFLGKLSESESHNLLMQLAFPKEEYIQDPDMLAIGKEIARKCFGVPLVVRTVGGLLFFKKTKPEWLHFKNYELPEVSRKEDPIKSVLKLSYDHLPPHLKQCFAFCSLFPKDYVMGKQTLVNLWMAQGFIHPSGSQHLEDIAHEYFMDLLWSNFFQDYQEDRKMCKMHDLMHDLACSVAGTECWGAWDDRKPIHERTRHISWDSTSMGNDQKKKKTSMGKPLISCLKASALRTFLSVTGYWKSEPTSEADIWRLIQSFKRLRILDLHAANVEKVPRFICKLKHLTYLDLSSNNELKRLPNSIARLHNLQTLNLCLCGSLEELPRGITKLVSLRNLDIDGCHKLSYMPRGLEQLSSLHRLTRFILPEYKPLAKKYCGLGELNGLNNIRGRLSIENLGTVTVTDAVEESKAANLIEKCYLEFLDLSWGIFNMPDDSIIRFGDEVQLDGLRQAIRNRDEVLLDGLRPPDNLQQLTIRGYNGESFPSWMTELPSLVELTLAKCAGCKRFPQFGLSKLKHLVIYKMNSIEYIPKECLGSLTSLETLKINSLSRLTSLPLGLPHLSKLVNLEIWFCKELDLSKDESGNIILDFHGLQSLRSLLIRDLPKLESLPQWILQLRSLERLQIYKCKNLKALSEQIDALQSLQHLEIGGCFSLTSLPEAMRRLTSLTHLEIWPRIGEEV